MKDVDIIKKTVQDIRSLKIQGATAVAKASLEALRKIKEENLEEAAEKLSQARTTEPLTRNCLAYVLWQVKKGQDVARAVDLMLSRLSDVEQKIIKNGRRLIKPGMKILTHCHSSTVEKILKDAHQNGINFSVYLTETRPLFQGRITAKNLTKAGIKTTMIEDSLAPYTISHLDKIEINLILLGCDAIALNGSCVNKIGSFAISLAAQEADIPLYIVGTLLKFDYRAQTGKEIKIEERDPSEIWKNPPKGLRIINPAFDIVPAEKIIAYITEFGIIKPSKVKSIIKKNYIWIVKKQKAKKKFSYLHLGEKFNSQKHIIATYRIEPKESLSKTAEEVAAESSIGTWTKITKETEKRFNRLSAKVYQIDKKRKIVKIAYPLELFEKGNLPQLLSSIAGNIFGVKFVKNIRLLDIGLPEAYVKEFPGPTIGLRGIRKYLNIKTRPILASIIKPKEGLPVEEHVEIAKEVFRAGIDLIKDDENLTSPLFNPFGERLKLVMKNINQMKKPKLYAFNITAPDDLLMKRAKAAEDRGSKCIMVDMLIIGYDTVLTVRRHFPKLIIHGHRAMHAALTRNPRHGISMFVLAKLARLSGIDQLHTGTIIGKMEGEKKETLKINQFLRSEWYGLKRTLPIASGGLYPVLIPDLVNLLGKNIIIAFGGGIHGHPKGPYAGGKAVVEAVEAIQKKIPLKEYAKTHKNLKIALKTWPKKRWQN